MRIRQLLLVGLTCAAACATPAHAQYPERAIKLVVQVSRLQDGTRKILSIAEVLGIRDDKVHLQEIFTFERTGVTDSGKVQGRFHGCGVTPKILDRLRVSGLHLPANIFEESVPVNL